MSSEGRRNIGSGSAGAAGSAGPASEKRKVAPAREAWQPPRVVRSSSAKPSRPPSAAPAAKVAVPQTKRLQEVDSQKVLRTLKAQCEELKQASNALSEENMKIKTRLLSMEHEFTRRDRLLKLVASNEKDGKGITQDVLEKLGDERNMIPILRRKEQDLRRQIEAKEEDVQKLKRHKDFTRIVELQVENTSWTRELLRLDSLLQNPSLEGNPVARAEVEVHKARVEKLEAQLRNAEERSQSAKETLCEAQDAFEGKRDALLEQRAGLRKLEEESESQDRELERLQKEQVQIETDKRAILELRQRAQGLNQELEELQDKGRSLAETPQFGPCAVTEAALSSPQPHCEPEDSANLWALRRACLAPCDGQAPLLAQLLEADSDGDGVLDAHELTQALRLCRLPVPSEEAARLLDECLPSVPGAVRGSVRVLDLLVGLHRLGGRLFAAPPALPAPLPELRLLRSACLKSSTGDEELRRRLLAVGDRAQAEELFASLGLPEPCQSLWIQAWLRHGTPGLLARLPLSEAAPSDEDRLAWMARYQEAVSRHRSELEQGFEYVRANPQSQDLVITEEDFLMVCRDTFRGLLSEADLDDLVLLASCEGLPSLVNGAAILVRN